MRSTPYWLCVLVILSGCASRPPAHPSTNQSLNTSAESRAIHFLAREVPAWSEENHCFSCHNNGDATRALFAAAAKGYEVQEDALTETIAWLRHPEQWEHNRGDPGFSDLRLANIEFAAALLAGTKTGHIHDQKALAEAARKIAAQQDPDGSWAIEPGNPVGSPATYGTVLATCVAWKILRAAPNSETLDATVRAENWLRKVTPHNIPTAASLLLALADNSRVFPASRNQECLDFLRRAQSQSGGWGPYVDAPTEAFDTALALLALSEMERTSEIARMIERGRAFLIAEQEPDGGWPATTRPSGEISYAQRISTTGWVTLALLKTAP